MDDDIVDVLIVLGILGVGILGGVILLIKYEGFWHRLMRVLRRKGKEEEEEKIQKIKRTTIVIARQNHKVSVEQCKKKAHPNLTGSIKQKNTIVPFPFFPAQMKHTRETPLSPILETNESITPKTPSDPKAVFIFNVGKRYKATPGDAATSLSSPTDTTHSTYLPSQMAPIEDRRKSMG